MLNSALRLITNGLYLVPWRVAQYQRQVSGIAVVVAGAAKGRLFRQAAPVQREMDLAIAILVRVQMEAGQPNAVIQGSQPEDIQQAISQLVTFLAAGMRS